MKKILIGLAFVLGTSFYAECQEIGARFGAIRRNHVALDAVFKSGEFNRIHANVSFGDGVGIDVIWDLFYRPLGGEAFNWYMGFGPYTVLGEDPFELGAVGEIGLEYRFNNIPIAIGVDWRPYFEIIEDTELDAEGFGLNVRWRFGSAGETR
ncbi:outer membrane insertion C- signal [Marinigracilibium pacificum]|uniref:Outer membrane insertion C- signal n=1 Tax=Marinigracilibium pacificum TaxID=2729599 RepID=A0A848IYH6_9BACT|nr:outer membrane insertion C- signal [Marinigracilibium pacificum]NMM48218.1 outer membrane insertion C- signal [Marinigracilibium pacificum]